MTGQDSEPRIPVLEMVDAKLHAGKLDGYRYARHAATTPRPGGGWPRVSTRSAREHGADEGFAARGLEAQHEIVQRFSEGELDWESCPCARPGAW